MSDYSKFFEEMMEQGQKMVRAFNPALENFQAHDFDKMMPTMPKEFMELVWGNAVNAGGLDARTRMLVLLAGMTVQGVPVEATFKLTVRYALQAGASEQEIAEVLGQMALLAGLPAMGKALGLAQSVFAENTEGEAP